MTLRHIKICLTVCENGNNLTKSAEKLFIAQPAVSFAISELEHYYGVRFFDRISHRLYLTEAGKMFRSYAGHISALFDDMEKGIRDWGSMGILRIGASVTIGSQLLPEYVHKFSSRYPELTVHASVDRSERMERMLMENELDFALIEGTVHEANLTSVEYQTDRLVLICAPDRGFQPRQLLAPEELARQKFLLRERGSGTRETFEHTMEAAGFPIAPVWESISSTALIHAAANGLGVAVLSESMVREPLRQGLVIPLRVRGMEFARKFQAVYHKDKFLTEPARDFIRMCRDSGAEPGEAQNGRLES